MNFRLTLFQQALILVLLPIVFEVVFVIWLACLVHQAEYEAWQGNHAEAVVAQAKDLHEGFSKAIFALATFSMSHSDQSHRQYEALCSFIPQRLRTIEILVHDNKDQLHRFRDLAQRTDMGLVLLDNIESDLSRDNTSNLMLFDAAKIRSKTTKLLQGLVDALHAFTEAPKQTEDAAPDAKAQAEQNLDLCLSIGLLLNLALGIGLVTIFNVWAAKRWKILLDNTQRLASGAKINPPLEGNDEIAQLDRSFHTMANDLAQTARQKQDLMEMVSHDVRSPLTSIRVFLESLIDGNFGALPETAQRPAAIAETNAARLIRLVSDLLDVEKLSAGKAEINPKPCCLAEIIDTAVEATKAQAQMKNVSLEVTGATPELLADPDRLVQVTVNLLANAIKFSNQNGTVKLLSSETEKYIRVEVQDQGPGIPASSQSKIFERFQMAEHEGSKDYKGSGLGLYICQVIVEAHGGTIGVVSEEDKGSTFWFQLPNHEQPEPD